MGITEADLTAGRYPCIRTTTSDGSPIPVDDGRSLGLTDVIPHSISEYMRQMFGSSGVAADYRAGRVLGGLAQDQQSKVVKRPFVFNPEYGRPLVHRMYNVLPVNKQRTSPWREVFTGPTSLICQNTAIIETYGFAPLAQEACGGGAELLSDPAPPSYRIRNVKSGKCLSNGTGSVADGAQLSQWTCGSGAEQQWTWTGIDGRQLKNSLSGKCLAIGGGSTASGAQAIQWTCGSGTEQRWILEADPAGESYVKNAKSSHRLTVYGGGLTDGTKVVQSTAAGNAAEQHWILETATTVTPGDDVLMSTAPSGFKAGAPMDKAAEKAATPTAAGNEWVNVIYPKRLVDIRNGRCRMQGYWNSKALRPGSEPVGGVFFDTRAYVVGPKCAVTMHLQIIDYEMRGLGFYIADHYYDSSKPSSSGKNERWMFWGPIAGGNYHIRVGTVPYLLTYTLKDMTTGGMASVGAIWGPKANWCDGWNQPGACPTTT
ncbi:RICIN domain-containing protein [Nonomuraea antimicrobica]